jgi:hypothetical protein
VRKSRRVFYASCTRISLYYCDRQIEFQFQYGFQLPRDLQARIRNREKL